MKRFAARRGILSKFLSDNGKTFKAAAKYIKVVLKDATVKEYLGCLTLSVLHGGEVLSKEW